MNYFSLKFCSIGTYDIIAEASNDDLEKLGEFFCREASSTEKTSFCNMGKKDGRYFLIDSRNKVITPMSLHLSFDNLLGCLPHDEVPGFSIDLNEYTSNTSAAIAEKIKDGGKNHPPNINAIKVGNLLKGELIIQLIRDTPFNSNDGMLLVCYGWNGSRWTGSPCNDIGEIVTTYTYDVYPVYKRQLLKNKLLGYAVK